MKKLSDLSITDLINLDLFLSPVLRDKSNSCCCHSGNPSWNITEEMKDNYKKTKDSVFFLREEIKKRVSQIEELKEIF